MNNTTIASLIEEIKEAVDSEENRKRGKKRPVIGVGIEEPIAWTTIFGFDANRYFHDPSFYVEQTLRQKLWRWKNIDDDTPLTLDMPTWLSHYPEYTFFGIDVSHNARGVPTMGEHPLSREPNLKLLEPVDFFTSGWMPRALCFYEELKQIADGRMNVTFLTWWRGCLDLAIQLRGYDNFIADTAERPDFLHSLLEFITEQRINWHAAYCRYFGQKIGPAAIGDDWINIPFISPKIFADFVLPCYLKIERFHGSIAGIHSCGNQTKLQNYLLQIKSLNSFEVSPWTDLKQTLINIPADKHLNISVHPNDVLVDGPSVMRAKLQFIRDSCAERSYNLGTAGLTPITGNHQEFLDRIHTWLDIAHAVFW